VIVDALERAERPTVLLVAHDSGLLHRMLTALESDYRVRVIEANDPESVLGKLHDAAPDLIVMHGDQRVTRNGVPILRLTAAADAAARLRALQTGADDYLLVPFEPEELRARANNLLQKRKLEIALSNTTLAREMAEQANREIAEFLSLLSHELRSPLAAIHLQLELLARGQKHSQTPQEAEVVAKIARSSSRVSEMVELLLHFAVIESGGVVPEVTPFDLRATAVQVVEGLRPRAEAKKLALRLESKASSTQVLSDPRLVRLVIANLCDNTIKYASEGEIVLAIDAAQPGVTRLTIATAGSNIPEDGLRFLLVKRIVGVLSAELAVETTADGRGTRFKLHFRGAAAE
jgi:signal transduction histidine kinase